MGAENTVLVLGNNEIARRIGRLLQDDGRLAVTLGSEDPEELRRAEAEGLATARLDGPSLREALTAQMAGKAAVILTGPAESAGAVAAAAAEAGCHYVDVLEHAAAATAVGRIAGQAAGAVAFAPGSGLAPGYVTALAAAEAEAAGPGAELTIFVGVLPAQPKNRLGYANIWGVDGLTDEYTQTCLGIAGGELVQGPPLADREQVEIGGTTYEAFTTAGSVDALAQAQAGRLRGLVFKTLRYPGHLDYIRFMLDDLGLSRQLYRFRSLLLSSLPHTENDRVVIAIRTRLPDGATRWTRRILTARPRPEGGWESAMIAATAAHAAAVADVLVAGLVRRAGAIASGSIPVETLRRSPFFGYFDEDRASGESGNG